MSKEIDKMMKDFHECLKKDFNGSKNVIDALYELKRKIETLEQEIAYLNRRDMPYGGPQ